MSERSPLPDADLNAAGLNRQHVFDLDDLPPEISAPLNVQTHERQLILIGHGGRQLWNRIQSAGMNGPDPIDDYTTRSVQHWFAARSPHTRYRILYPGTGPIGLQALGKLAGWHAPSPFMVGIDTQWGSWYAYRAVVLADSNFCPSVAVQCHSPCATCKNPPCLAACPADALTEKRFDFQRCATYRLQTDSACALGCLARQACPVGAEHRYDTAQITHSYRRSLAFLHQYFT